MAKKIIFKTASMVRDQHRQSIPEDVTKKIDDWIKSTPENISTSLEANTEKKPSELVALPENKTVRLNLNISNSTHKEIKKICAEKGISITDFVTRLLQNEIGIE